VLLGILSVARTRQASILELSIMGRVLRSLPLSGLREVRQAAGPSLSLVEEGLVQPNQNQLVSAE